MCQKVRKGSKTKMIGVSQRSTGDNLKELIMAKAETIWARETKYIM